MQNQKVLILNFGGQYDQLIARRVRECNVYCEVKPYTMTLSEIRAFDPIGIIFTGGPDSVYKENSYHPAEGIFELGIPILGICYGCQLLAHHLGGMVTAAENENAREYGKTLTFYDNSCLLFDGLDEESISWMSHGDYMKKVPDGFRLVARSGKCPNVAICDENRKYYGVQFHPEVNHTENKEIIEPLRLLFKDEVRELGRQLGLPEYMVMRQPFPGPGLAIRVIGEITKEKLDILREADAIFREEIAKAKLEMQMNQYFAVLTNMKSVGVMGDGRTYDWAVALRSVTTEDFMTADWSRIPYEVLDKVSGRIVNEVSHVNRVLYDITSKPPATVEFE